MANKETLQNYNTNLSGNNDTLKSILDTINNLPEAGEGGGSSSILPEDYTELLYIKSSGEQYIDTDLMVTEKTNFTATFRTFDGFTTSSFGCIFATRQTYNANGYQLTTYPGNTQPANTGHFMLGGGWYSAGMITNDIKQTVSFKDGILYGPTDLEVDLSSVKTTPPGTMRIFALKDTSAGETGVYDLAKVALYELIFEENGVPVANYVPAKRNTDGVVGLYDMVSGNFYTNKGTGLFDYEDKFTGGASENLDNELTTQETRLTEQEAALENIITLLQEKGYGETEDE